MSLGLIGKYGSDSSSGSDDDGGGDSKSKVLCESTDPLSLGLDGSDDSSDSNSETNSTSPVPSHGTSLPLPDIDNAVARNPSYSASGLATKPNPTAREQEGSKEESSVFFNPFKKAEEEKLAILKHHVQEFDKNPFVAEENDPKRGCNKRGYRGARRGYHGTGRSYHGSSSTAIPPPMSYVKQSSRGHHMDMTDHGGQMAGEPPIQYSGGRNPYQVTGGPQFSRGPIGWDPNNPGGPVRGTPYQGGPVGGDPYWEESTTGNELFDDNDSSSLAKKPRKHRSGVTDSLIPPKKFMRAHEKIQAKERPWTMGK